MHVLRQHQRLQLSDKSAAKEKEIQGPARAGPSHWKSKMPSGKTASKNCACTTTRATSRIGTTFTRTPCALTFANASKSSPGPLRTAHSRLTPPPGISGPEGPFRVAHFAGLKPGASPQPRSARPHVLLSQLGATPPMGFYDALPRSSSSARNQSTSGCPCW
jgi:hypothetical protein